MKIRDLLTDKSKWLQGGLAKVNGSIIFGLDTLLATSHVQSHCLVGALFRCYSSSNREAMIVKKIDEALRKKGWHGSIAAWNDDPSRRFKHVRSLVEELDI